MEPVCHSCPKASIGVIPNKIVLAARKGMIEEVKSWLDNNGGDVNGGDERGLSLLNHACYNGQTAIVKELLKYPDLHLNPFVHGFVTPIAQAALKGFLDITEILLNASLKCRADPNNVFHSISPEYNSAISLTAKFKHWKVVEYLLKNQDNIIENHAFCVISHSLNDNEWGIVLDLVQRDYSFDDKVIGNLLEKAYLGQHWEVVSEVSRKIVLYNNDISLIPINLMLKNKDWKTLELVFKFIKGSVSIDSNLAKVVLAKQNQDVQMALEKEKYDTDILSGTMLLAAVGGTSEKVAEILMNQSNYSSEILNYSLILSALFNRLELLPLLLQGGKFNCQTLSRARKVSDKQGHTDCVFLLKGAFSMKRKEILQIDEVNFKNDFINKNENDGRSDFDESEFVALSN